MSRYRDKKQSQAASPEVSRLIIVGFLIAGAIGFVMGVAWIAWNLIKIHVLGQAG